jgi:hypothetical protein
MRVRCSKTITERLRHSPCIVPLLRSQCIGLRRRFLTARHRLCLCIVLLLLRRRGRIRRYLGAITMGLRFRSCCLQTAERRRPILIMSIAKCRERRRRIPIRTTTQVPERLRLRRPLATMSTVGLPRRHLSLAISLTHQPPTPTMTRTWDLPRHLRRLLLIESHTSPAELLRPPSIIAASKDTIEVDPAHRSRLPPLMAVI